LVTWWGVVFLLAGAVHGVVGFGFPFVATPLIALTTDIRTAVVVVVLPTVVTTTLNIVTSGPLRPVLARFWMMPIYTILGSFAGTWLFIAAPRVPYSLLLALLTLLYLNVDRMLLGQ